MKSKTSSLISLVFSILTLISMLVLTSPSTSAEDVIDDVAITVPSACSFTDSTEDATFTRTLNNNHYESGIGTNTFTVACNDIAGFSIYAIGYSGEEYGNTNMLPSTSGLPAIATGTATSGNTSAWAMKLTPVSGTYAPTIQSDSNGSFANYHIVPSTFTKVATFTQIVDGSVGSSMTSDYAVFISSTQPAGTYTGKVKYTLVHPSSEEPAQPQPARAGYIVYHPNNSAVVGQMGDQSASNNTSVTLWASNFKRDGYGFVGWNDKYDYTGNFYGPNQTITAPSDVSTKGLSLYAVWVKSAGTIQNWNGCSSLTKANEATDIFSQSITALTDERDGNTYAVAKLADDKCWTIENLRLADKDSSNNDINLSSTNTHNPSLPLNNSWYYKNQQGTLTTSNHLSATSDPTSTNPDTAWCQIDSSDCNDQSMLATNNTTLFTSNTASGYSASSNVYSYGNYYNWYSATAGHGKYGDNYGSSFVSLGDICPTSWHLPTANTNGEYYNLNYAINDNNNTTDSTASQKIRSYPNNFVYSGSVSVSSVSSRNSYGRYWSASGYNSTSAYYLGFYSTGVTPGTGGASKWGGRMVRCVAGV